MSSNLSYRKVSIYQYEAFARALQRKISPEQAKLRARQVFSNGEHWNGRQCLFWAGFLPDNSTDILSNLQATIS